MLQVCQVCLRNSYACLQVLVNNALTWQSSCVIANNAQKTAKYTKTDDKNIMQL